MSKLKIELLDPVHQCQYRVLYGDTDSGGVLYYGNYLRYFEQGRTELMREHGISYKGLEEFGFILPVVESYVRYKAPARYDDLLTIHTSLVEVKKVSCRFNYKTTCDQNFLVKGFTIHAVVNDAGKLVKFPEHIFSRLNTLCGGSI